MRRLHNLAVKLTAGAAMADILGHGARELSVADMEAMAEQRREIQQPTRGQIIAADMHDLVWASHQQIVLAHIHPRWLRKLVASKLDAGEDVNADDVARLRAAGPA